MKDVHYVTSTTVDCDQCYKEVTFEGEELPDDWIAVTEGASPAIPFEFCSPVCLAEWRNEDKEERHQKHFLRVLKKRNEEGRTATV